MDKNPTFLSKIASVKSLKSKKIINLGALILFVIFVFGGGYLGYKLVYINGKSSKPLTKEQVDENIRQTVTQRQDYFSNLISSINSVSDLKKQDMDTQMSIAQPLMARFYSEKNFQQLLTFARYFADFKGTTGMEGLRYCYLYTPIQSDKDTCYNKLHEKARAEGIIGKDEQLPEVYLIEQKEQ